MKELVAVFGAILVVIILIASYSLSVLISLKMSGIVLSVSFLAYLTGFIVYSALGTALVYILKLLNGDTE